MIASVPHVRAIPRYAPAEPVEPGMVSLARGDGAFAPGPAVITAGYAALAEGAPFPDPDWRDLRAAISEVHGVDAGAVLCGAGMTELIGALVRAFVGPGDTVLGSEFGYAAVAIACAQAGVTYEAAPDALMCASVENIARAVTPRTRMVVLCNPGNPSGTLIANAKIQWLRDNLPENVLLVIDQALAEFADEAQPPAPLFDLTGRGNTVILRSFSKAFALAGARVGWGLFPAALAGEVRKLLSPGNIPAVSQAMAAAAMRDRAHLGDVVRRTARIRAAFAKDLRSLGIAVPPSYANFVLLQFPSVELAQRSDRALRAAGLLLRRMDDYGLPWALRATVTAPQVMDRVLDVLRGELG